MRMVTDQDIFDISEYLLNNIEDYTDRFEKFGEYLTFEDFLKDQLSLDLSLKYTKYQIEEAFEDERLQIILDFYTNELTGYDTVH